MSVNFPHHNQVVYSHEHYLARSLLAGHQSDYEIQRTIKEVKNGQLDQGSLTTAAALTGLNLVGKMSQRYLQATEPSPTWNDVSEGLGKIIKNVVDHYVKNPPDLSKITAADMRMEYIRTTVSLLAPLVIIPLVYKVGSSGIQYVYEKALDGITKPKLSQKTKTITWTSQFTDYVKERVYGPDKTNVPIFDKELTEDVAEIIDVTKNIKKNKSFFQNVILYGPGGTGKTMLAEMIAKESGLNYVMMSGGELAQFIKRKEHVGEFNKFWDAAKRASMPTVVFIDEAESLCKDRKNLDAEHMELLNAFLARTGTEDKQVMIVLATNRIQDIDEAVLNRMTHKIHVKPPALLQRIEILWKYIMQFFTNKAERDILFPESKVKQIAEKTDGFTGRTLFQVVNALYAKKGATQDNKLTPAMVDKVVDRFLVQNKGMLEAAESKKEAEGGPETAKTPGNPSNKR